VISRRAPIILCCAALAAACSILPEPHPVDIWLLPAPPAPSHAPDTAAEAAPRGWSLRLVRPVSAGHLATQRIVVVPAPGQVSVYKGANWHDPIPLLLRNRLFDAFREDGRVGALSTDEQRVFADFELVSELRAFQSEYSAPGPTSPAAPEIVIQLDASLIDAASRRILTSQRFEARVYAGDESIPQIVHAFARASNQLGRELVSWAVDAGDRAWR
jgi:cholesterol transport system auxiliary component